MASESDDQEIRASRYEKDVHDLTTQVSFLEEEVAMLRRRLTESPRHLRMTIRQRHRRRRRERHAQGPASTKRLVATDAPRTGSCG